MNCCLWIIVLLACRGNGGNCECSHTRVSRCEGQRNDCMPVPYCACRQNEDAEWMLHSESCEHREECRDAVECGCMKKGTAVRMPEGNAPCNEQRMSYETFGCQENGIPCPPPMPGNLMR